MELASPPDEPSQMRENPTKPNLWTYYLAGLLMRMSDNHHFLVGAGLAFATLFTLVPLVFLVFFILGAFLDPASMNRLVDMTVEVVVPYEKEATHMKDILYSRIPEVVEFKEAYGLFGLSILIFSASGPVQRHAYPPQYRFQSFGRRAQTCPKDFLAMAGGDEKTGGDPPRGIPVTGRASGSWLFSPQWES